MNYVLAGLAIIGTTIAAVAWIVRAAMPYVLIGLGATLGFWLLMQGVLWQLANN